MYISKIEIDNFKSFANRTEIPFLGGFTTVSGPNGSGKSNIIDSILFGLGLSSSRSLRAEKLFHLINTHNKKNEASVKVYFADLDGKEILNVTRKIRKAPSGFLSSYYLNDRVSTLGEIHDKLSLHNISPGCYNVMMQGDVTSIINVSPNERRKIIDEIAGVADFDRRIEQAKKELETVEQRVDKSNIVLGEIDLRLNQLGSEREQALKYQKLRDEKLELEGKLQIVRYFEIKNSFERLHESVLDANKNRKEEEKRLEGLRETLEAAQKQFTELSEVIKSKGEDEQIEIKKQIESLKGLISRKRDSIKFSENQIQGNLKNIESAKQSAIELKQKIEDSHLRIENKNDEIQVIEDNITTEKEKLQELLNEVSGINKTASDQVEKRNSLRKLLESKKDEENNILKEKITLEEKVSSFRRQIEESRSKIKELEDAKNGNSDSKNLLETQIIELTKELQDYEISQKANLETLDKTKNELSDLNYNIQTAYRKIAQFEANKRAAEESNFDRAVNTIMSADLGGVHAPLAQLGKVNKEYSTALEIAMGGRMKSVVVDDDEVARVAIEILKSSNAGRATFLPLNKMRPKPWGMRVPNNPGVIDFALNLVEFDGAYENVFYYALGETLIVEDFEAARSLMGKYRMVTLDGSLFEKTGAVTGGSSRRTGIKFAQSQDEELENFKERLKKLEERQAGLEKRKIDTENRLDEVRRDYSGAMTELNRKKLELGNISRNLENADSIAETNEEKIKTLAPVLENSEKSLFEVENKLANLSAEIENLSGEIEIIEQSLPDDELKKLNDLTESVEFEIKRFEGKLSNCSNEIKSINMEIDFNEKGIGIQEERVKTLIEENAKLEIEKEGFYKEIETTDVKVKELDVKLGEIGSELTGLQQERDELNQKVLNLEKQKTIIETRIDRLQEQVEAFKTRRKELEPELSAIRNELTEQGYEVTKLTPTDVSVEEVNKNIAKLDKRMAELEPVNMKALTEYDEVKERKDELKNRIDTLTSEKQQIIEKMDGYEELKIKAFRETYDNINSNFKEIFYQLSDGEGKIILENEINPLAGGLTIEAQPRGKKMQRLESMSGGEKSLTALAFVFAIQRYLPAPFYAFDEVDMHLDGINAEKLAQMIRTQASNTQFIVVSLRKPMIEAADRTIGVTQKDSGITKVTGVRLHG